MPKNNGTFDVLEKLVDKLIKLKTPVQLTGFLAVAVIWFLAVISSPMDYMALIIGGLIAVSILFFGVILNQLKQISHKQRAWFILAIYIVFAIVITIFLALAISYLQSNNEQLHQGRAIEIRKNMQLRVGQLEKSLIENLEKEEALARQLRTIQDMGSVTTSKLKKKNLNL